MKYLLMIYSNEAKYATMPEEKMKTLMTAYFALNAEAQERNVYISGESLMPTQTATTVRVSKDKVLTTDGPFAETKEQLGGYYLLNCANLDEAIEFAAKIAKFDDGASIEVRPVVEF